MRRTPRRTSADFLQIAQCGSFQVGVTQQDLNGAQVSSGFEQVGGEGVPQGVRMNRLRDAGRLTPQRGRPGRQFWGR